MLRDVEVRDDAAFAFVFNSNVVVAIPVLKIAFCPCRLSCGPTAAWVAEVEAADWKGPQDIKDRYATASFLGGNQVVFNLGGNKYRLLVVVTYANGIVAVRRVGTHEEYDRWDLR